MVRIIISVITYNQENVIHRALDSVLCQKEWGLYRLVVSDDCSSDHTWEVLQKYKEKYPTLIEIHRNEHNLGIYGNVQRVDSYLPDGDLYGSLSGDDEYCKGYFEALQKLVEREKIDVKSPIGIYSDWKSVSPEGKENVFRQNLVASKYPLVSLKIRGFITSRSVIVSKAVRDLYAPMILDRGLALAEGSYDIQSHINIKEAYYMPIVTSVYYTEVGVSKELSVKKSDYLTTQHAIMWQYFIDNYLRDKKDIYYAEYEVIKAKFLLHPTFVQIVRMFYYFNLGQLKGLKQQFAHTIHLFLSYIKYLIVR